MKVFLLGCLIALVNGQFDPHFVENRQGIVHLFEWKWLDIANECETFLGPNGYGGIQVSPVNENAVVEKRPWYERYQPMSYKLETRSGNEDEFKEMVKRCRDAGVRIYVDVVVNHMAPSGSTPTITGTGGSTAEPADRTYPAASFSVEDFNQPFCDISNYSNATNVRVCGLAGLPDLNQTRQDVRDNIVEFMDHLTDLGVAGFRMDACKHMFPNDLRVIFGRLKSLSPENGFKIGDKPFMFQEVIDLGGEAVRRQEYIPFGTVTEFTGSTQIGMIFRGIDRDLSALENWASAENGFLPSKYSFVFVDNHDNQRGHGSGGSMILTHKDKNLYTKAVAFMLAHPQGGDHPRIMSSFAFSDPSQGPPMDEQEQIIAPTVDESGQCNNGWVCEHRWPAIVSMIKFRSAVRGTTVRSFTNIGKNQVSFCRGTKGFIAINNSDNNLRSTVPACLPNGVYCDVISGELKNGICTGKTITVQQGKALIEIPSNDANGIIAIHAEAKPSLCACS